MLVGSGLRISELSGLAVRGPHGLSDVMLDSLERGRAELRVRWDAGARVARPGVHAHGFRHTFATVATRMGWNLERVRAANASYVSLPFGEDVEVSMFTG